MPRKLRLTGAPSDRIGPQPPIHALRHSAGTRLYEATGDIYMVAHHLRHSAVQTAAVYAKMADQSYRDAVAEMESANNLNGDNGT